MGLFENFPYTNFHELNLMWILEALKEIQSTTEQFVAINSLKYADPIQWNIVQQYEKNTIVIDPLTGTAYISVQPVPSGVSLTNTDYWTVVFDLGSFVTRAAKNFTERWEEDTTLTATFSTAAGQWLVWGDTLYIAQVNITAGDSYVVDSNIKRITIEEVKDSIYTTFNNLIGNLDDLTTSNKDNLVYAINEIVSHIGDLDSLNTTDKSNLVAAINEVLQTLTDTIGDINDLTTVDKSNMVNAINELNANVIDLQERHPYLSSLWTQIWIDTVNGDDDNDGLAVDRPLKSFAAVRAKYIDAKHNKGGYISSYRFNILSTGDIYIDQLQGVSNVQMHFYNESGGSLTLKLDTQYQARTYNCYWHFNGTAIAPITFDANGDDTFGGDNNSYWFSYTTIINTGTAISQFFQYAKGCEFTFEHATIDDTNLTLLFRDSNIWCQGAVDIKPKTQLIGGSLTSINTLTISTMQLNECIFNVISTLNIVLDFAYRNYCFSTHGSKIVFNQPCTVNITTTGAFTGARPLISGTGNEVCIPYAVTFNVVSLSEKFTELIYGADNIRNIIIPTNILDFCTDIYTDLHSKSNIDKSVYGAFHKDLYSESPNKTLADLNGMHFDAYFTGHFLSLNIQGDNVIIDLTNVNNRCIFFLQKGSLGQFVYGQLNISLTNTPAGGCTINVGSSSRLFEMDVTTGTCTSTADLSILNLFEVNMF